MRIGVLFPRLQDATHSQPVCAGHEDIEHDGLRREGVHLEQSVVSVDRGVDLVALEPQRPLDRVANMRVVLDYEHPIPITVGGDGHAMSLAP